VVIIRSALGHLVCAFLAFAVVVMGIIYTKIKYPNRFKIKIYVAEPLKELDKEPKGLPEHESTHLPKEHSEGITHCTLRPFGKVVIHGKIYDAVSLDHKVVLKKTPIIVVGYENGRLVIKEKNTL